MICKQCGAEMAQTATKCRRCGNKIPPKSDCGGFYDLASAGTKLWEDSKPVAPAPAPAPVYIRETAPAIPPTKTKPFILMSVLAAVLAVCLIVSLLVDSKGNDAPPTAGSPTGPAAEAPTLPNGEPNPDATPWQPSFETAKTFVVFEGENFSITYTAEKLVYPFAPKVTFSSQWRYATMEDFNGLGENFTYPVEEDLAKYVVLDFNLDVDEKMFGAVREKTEEDSEDFQPLSYDWGNNKSNFWSLVNSNSIITNGNKVICNIEEIDDLAEITFYVEIHRHDTKGGTMVVAVSNIPYEALPVQEEATDPEGETEQEGAAGQEGTAEQEGSAEQESTPEQEGSGEQTPKPDDNIPDNAKPDTDNGLKTGDDTNTDTVDAAELEM